MEIAIEILAAKIADMSNNGYNVESSEMQELLSERQQLYSGNTSIFKKIITIYGPEMKKKFEGGSFIND